MPQSHKRKWSITEPVPGPLDRHQKRARQERVKYMRERVQRMMDEGITKEAWECMQEHPGKYCNNCNPRKKGVDIEKQQMVEQTTEDSDSGEDQDSEDEESEDDEGYETADMSEPWSDTSDCSDWGAPTYPKIFYEKEAETAVIEYWTFKIGRVDAVANCLTALDPNALKETPIGGLRGTWDLYSLDHRPKTLDEGSFYHRLIFTDNAVEGRLPNRERMMKPPFDHQFIEWTIGDEQGDIVPFRLPSHPSLEAVSVNLMTWRGEDVPAKIVFLGSDCLQFRALRSVLFPKEPGKPGEMMEFAGLRRTETEIAREKAQVREHNQRDSSPHRWFGEPYI